MERGSITLKSFLEEFGNIRCSTQTEIYLFIHSFIHFYPFFFLRLFSQIGTVRWCPVQKKQNRQRGILKLLYSGSMAIFFHKAENDIKAFGRKLFSTRVFDWITPWNLECHCCLRPWSWWTQRMWKWKGKKGKATGVAFHVKKPRSVPAVLHMFLEVAFEGFPVDNGYVTNWTRQGVLLLNTALTCPHNPPKGAKNKAKYKSHFGIWKNFTISLIRYIGGNTAEPSVWLLWGGKAENFSKYINKKHLIIKGGHPSTTGTAKHGDSFFGRNYFNIANEFLLIKRRGAIDWSLSSTGQNGFNLEQLLQTEVVLQQRISEEQQLSNQHQPNQHLI